MNLRKYKPQCSLRFIPFVFIIIINIITLIISMTVSTIVNNEKDLVLLLMIGNILLVLSIGTSSGLIMMKCLKSNVDHEQMMDEKSEI